MATRKQSGGGRSRNRSAGAGPALELDVRDVGHGGDAFAAAPDGQTMMLRGALPGERVLAEPRGKRRGVARARLLKVLSPSPERVEPACPYVARCGGCPWMAWALPAQRQAKRSWLQRAVAAAAPPELPVELVAAGPADGLQYRQTARLAFHRSGQGVALGYRAASRNQVVAVERCAVLAPALQAAMARLATDVAPQLQGSGDVALQQLAAGVAVHVRTDSPQPPAAYAALRAAVGAEIGFATLSVGDSREVVGTPDRAGRAYDDSPLQVPEHGFLQANHAVNAALVAAAAALAEAPGRRVLELYAGHGNLTVALAPDAASVLAIELDPDAAQAGRDNMRARGHDRARFVAGDVAERATGSRADVVVLDPPRTGAREVLPAILASRPERIVYVSCDTATLARDLGTLAAGGYAVDHATAFDMFPHTAHVESLVRLRRTGTPARPPRGEPQAG